MINHSTCIVCGEPKSVKNIKFCSESCYGIWKTNKRSPKRSLKYNKDKKYIIRYCLGIFCRGKRKFKSTWLGNRLCPRCQEYIEGFYDAKIEVTGNLSKQRQT